MAKYYVGPEKHYRDGRFYEEGDSVEIPDDEAPHPSWRKAGRSVFSEPEEAEEPEAEEIEAPTPETTEAPKTRRNAFQRNQ